MSDENVPAGTEQWKPVAGFHGIYSISDTGLLRREFQTNASKSGRIVKGYHHGRHGKKYVRYTLSHNGKSVRRFAHVLVLTAFSGDACGKVPHHINNDGCDNRICNLKWVSSSENTRLAYADGCLAPRRGAASTSAKINQAVVAAIREKYKLGWSCSALAQEYGINKSTAHRVATHRTWR